MTNAQTELKCSECYRKWCPERNTIRNTCAFIDKQTSEELSKEITIQIMEQIEAKVNPFYMVYVMGSNLYKTYGNETDAVNEAKRLCGKEQKSTYVLKAVKGFKFFSRIDEIKIKED